MSVKNKWLLAFVLSLSIYVSVMQMAEPVQAEPIKQSSSCLTPQMVQLKSDMQKAWIDHTGWSSRHIVSTLSNLPDQKEILKRLLQNQQDIGNVIKPYYGDAVGNKLAELLTEHTMIADRILAAIKAGNRSDVKKLNAEWRKNADDIAKFLSSINPNWSYDELQKMMQEHLRLVTEIVRDYIKQDWKAGIAVTDENEIHMIHFADLLTEGIVKQFPKKF